MFKRYINLVALIAAPAVFAGCSSDYNFTELPHTFDVDTQYKGIGLGETLQLKALDGNGAPVSVTWSSDNANIATVSSTGLVTGKSAGGPVNILATSGSEVHTSSITVLKGFIKAISGKQDEEAVYTIDVPAGATKLTVTIAGGPGDVDMYVKFGSTPTGGASDNCRSEKAGNGESCVINNPQAGKWYILTYAFEPFSGATLTVLYE
jgi:hypothetical protein